MVGPFEGMPFSFGALRKTFGPLYVRCDICRRFVHLHFGRHDLRDIDYRSKTFSCCKCGGEGALAIIDPTTERGMSDYRLESCEAPEHHPAAVDRLLGRGRSRRWVDQAGGELPGRNSKGRR